MKKIKGLTLVELIVVMAVMTILMSAIMQLFKPIREVFTDSTYYESQRTTQNGMVKYITESTRYATNLGIYSLNPLSQEDAIKKFCEDLPDGDFDIEVISIDNSKENTVNGTDYKGRIYRMSFKVTVSGGVPNFPPGTLPIKERLALGNAYYGPHTYSILIDPDPNDDPMARLLYVSVSSISTKNLTEQKNATTQNILTGKHVKTEGEVFLQNLSSTKVKNAGFYNYNDYTIGGSTTNGAVTYIIYTNP